MEISDTSGKATKDWKEAQSKYEQLTHELDSEIGLSMSFEGLSNKLQDWG